MANSFTKFVGIGGAVAVVLGACTIFKSSDPGTSGLTYYLPKTLVQVNIVPWGDVDRSDDLKRVLGIRITHLTLEIGAPEEVPDTSAQPYVLDYAPNVFFSDKLCAGIEGGLLQVVEVASKDETGNIAVAIAKLAGRLSGPGAFAGAPRTEVGVELTNHKITMLIDPLDPRDLRAMESAVRTAFMGQMKGGTISMPNGGRWGLSVDHAKELRGSSVPANCPKNSVCYRTKSKARMVLHGPGGYQSVAYVDVVNRGYTGFVDVTRAFMVEKITKLAFEGGVLKSMAINKPSQALSLAKLPLAIYDAVMTSALAAPGRFLSNISGLPPEQQLAVIKDLAAVSEQVKNMDANLRALRSDEFVGTAVADDNLFKIRCHGTKVAGNAG